MTAERAVILVKKVAYLDEFGYLNSSRIIKSIILMFLSSPREKIHAFEAKLGDRCLVMFLLVSSRHVGAHPDGRQPGVPYKSL